MNLRRVLGYGLASWAVPFVVSVLIFPLKQSRPPLFENLMAMTVTGLALVLGIRYLAIARPVSLRSAAAVGFLWWGVNLAIDLPLFSFGPMQRSLGSYLEDIGLAYSIYPMILAGLWSAGRGKSSDARA